MELYESRQKESELSNEDLMFFQGTLFMLAEVYRAHGCSTTVSDCITGICHVEQVARNSAEYDVKELRKIIKTLPMGMDADYVDFHIAESDLYEFTVFATELGASKREEIAEFNTNKEAVSQMKRWILEVEENQKLKTPSASLIQDTQIFLPLD